MINLNKINARLAVSKSGTATSKSNIWSPVSGRHIVRIIPYAHKLDFPFVELFIHYNLAGENYISPTTFGRPDPIAEFAAQLKKSKDKAVWKQGHALEPKLRTFVPILVRGEENKGVQYWGFNQPVYKDLLGVMADPDYGDISDLRTGRDVVVEYKTAEESSNGFPSTTVRVKPNPSFAFDPSNRELREKVKNQKKVTDNWPEPTYEQLRNLMSQS
jgi:gp32 DNA binding protein like